MGDPVGPHYSERGFWAKLRGLPEGAGCQVGRRALTLWCVLRADVTPGWAKAVVIGALGYLILPLDLLPDFLPGGFVDDLALMALALAEVQAHVTPGIEDEVERRLPERCQRRPIPALAARDPPRLDPP